MGAASSETEKEVEVEVVGESCLWAFPVFGSEIREVSCFHHSIGSDRRKNGEDRSIKTELKL